MPQRTVGSPSSEPVDVAPASRLASPRLVPVGDLHPWDENPRTISPERFENLRRAIAADPDRRFVRQDHDIATTAYTRAANRAISDMIGAGEISAEEVRATGEFTGISLEERAAIKQAWARVSDERRTAATSWLRSAGFVGETVAALFKDFALRASDVQVADLIGELADRLPAGDPDAILEEIEAS